MRNVCVHPAAARQLPTSVTGLTVTRPHIATFGATSWLGPFLLDSPFRAAPELAGQAGAAPRYSPYTDAAVAECFGRHDG
jgi:hypothetical protein